MLNLRVFARCTLAALFLVPANSAQAQFEPSQAKVFIDWPQLEVEPMQGFSSEFAIYALVDQPRVVYTITVTTRSNVSVMGAFHCNKEFTVLTSSTNGYYDIRCVEEDLFEQVRTYVLRMGKDGLYKQIF
ncbi:MAG TPA: hypothetical protein ENJ90_00830 [Devosia sp.]|nr:hypothetical protein [Devosia sp.]